MIVMGHHVLVAVVLMQAGIVVKATNIVLFLLNIANCSC